MRGDGSLFKRGNVWWFAYFKDGKRRQESLKTTDDKKAERRAQTIRRAILAGELPLPSERRVTVDDLVDDLLLHLRLGGRVYAPHAKSHLVAVRRELGHLRAGEVDTAAVQRYQELRRGEGKAAATVNRECQLLRQAYTLASRRQPPKVKQVLYVPLLKVDNARQGFLDRPDFEALVAAIANADERDYWTWFWWTGMRPSEIRRLTWEMYDRESEVLRLEGRITKTGKGRSLAIAGPLEEIFKRRAKARVLACPLIFHRDGRPLSETKVRDRFKEALTAAKLPGGLRPYDLRRTAIRNLVRAGVDERVAMTISGHRTRSTFDRYNITSAEDVKAAIERTAAWVKTLPTQRRIKAFKPRGKR